VKDIPSPCAATGTTLPIRATRAASDAPKIAFVRNGLAAHYAVVPQHAEGPVGAARLRALRCHETAPV